MLYRVEEAARRAKELGLYAHKQKSFLGEGPQKPSNSSIIPNLPSIDVSYINLQISHVRTVPCFVQTLI